MGMRPVNIEAYQLLHQGSIALSKVEANGIRVDTDYLNKALKETGEEIERLNNNLKKDKIYETWRKRFGERTKIDSNQQLGEVLFNVMGYPCVDKTDKGKPKTDEEALEKVDLQFVTDYLQAKKLKKARGTYLTGIRRETVHGFLHPVFNLHFAQTYRGSCDSPNFQNMPIRRYEIAKLIRQCFIPRKPTNHIIESDYSGVEVHGAYWYHQDPVMFEYLSDKTKDMHRDMAQACFMLPNKQMIPTDKKDAKRIKKIRYCGKNMFVFPQFYGDWFYSCGPSLWNAMESHELKLRSGTTVREWLKHKGIRSQGSVKLIQNNKGKWVYPPTKPGTFIDHIKKVESNFWNKKFKVYKQWKDEWYAEYLENGGFTTLTGFYIDGPMKRNEVLNYPVQGVAFHCLLWSLIRLTKLFHKYKMKSLIIGQIHDSIVGDVPRKERKDYLELSKQVMTVDLKKHWPFVNSPLEVEAEVAPAGKSWFEKEVVEI